MQSNDPKNEPAVPRFNSLDIVFFAHPDFSGHVSLPRFVRMLSDGMKKRGHRVQVWSPTPRFVNFSIHKRTDKWLGYIDQYLMFPNDVRRRFKTCSNKTLFVFSDNALGPWVPLVCDKPHVIHCHDFMAQRSALGLIPENRTGWSGRQYQKYIWRGYSKGKNFISGSENTRRLLHQFLPSSPVRSEMVYNGLNQSFNPADINHARATVGAVVGSNILNGYMLHVGGNQWYKNRTGVIQMYDAWRAITPLNLPLILIGLPASLDVLKSFNNSPYKQDIHFLTNANDEFVKLAYSGATAFLFPSLEEGFGWPIAEAMASGCPVITTSEPPMTEVAGRAAFLIPRRPFKKSDRVAWAKDGARAIDHIVKLSHDERRAIVAAGLQNAKRFDTEIALDQIERIYVEILNGKNSA